MSNHPLATHPDCSLITRLLDRTSARLLTGAAGPCYRTATQLQLRLDHAVAIDAVRRELDLEKDLTSKMVHDLDLFEVTSRAKNRDEYLLRPDLGRQFDTPSRDKVSRLCPPNPNLQILVGDGLSATAVAAQVPALLPELMRQGLEAGWTLGRPFVVRNCRVGILNGVGELLNPEVVILLLGERPGLATAESLSAYFAWRPRPGHTDAHRNLISNIHAGGIPVDQAIPRILALAAGLRAAGMSGVGLRENLPQGDPFTLPPPTG